MNLRNKFFILLTIGIFLTGQWGCATGPYGYPKPEPLLEKYREQLGTIGVITTSEIPDIQFDRPLPPPGPGVLERIGQGTVDGGQKSFQWWWDNVLDTEATEGVVIIAPPPWSYFRISPLTHPHTPRDNFRGARRCYWGSIASRRTSLVCGTK